MGYSTQRRESILKKMLPSNNRSVRVKPVLNRSSDGRLYCFGLFGQQRQIGDNCIEALVAYVGQIAHACDRRGRLGERCDRDIIS
jgi:hypothetical protein